MVLREGGGYPREVLRSKFFFWELAMVWEGWDVLICDFRPAKDIVKMHRLCSCMRECFVLKGAEPISYMNESKDIVQKSTVHKLSWHCWHFPKMLYLELTSATASQLHRYGMLPRTRYRCSIGGSDWPQQVSDSHFVTSICLRIIRRRYCKHESIDKNIHRMRVQMEKGARGSGDNKLRSRDTGNIQRQLVE